MSGGWMEAVWLLIGMLAGSLYTVIWFLLMGFHR